MITSVQSGCSRATLAKASMRRSKPFSTTSRPIAAIFGPGGSAAAASVTRVVLRRRHRVWKYRQRPSRRDSLRPRCRLGCLDDDRVSISVDPIPQSAVIPRNPAQRRVPLLRHNHGHPEPPRRHQGHHVGNINETEHDIRIVFGNLATKPPTSLPKPARCSKNLVMVIAKKPHIDSIVDVEMAGAVMQDPQSDPVPSLGQPVDHPRQTTLRTAAPHRRDDAQNTERIVALILSPTHALILSESIHTFSGS